MHAAHEHQEHLPVTRTFGMAHWACILGLWITVTTVLYSHADKYAQFPLDSYYYLEMAGNFTESGRPVIRFEQGYPNKFFPGYPIFLGMASLFSEPIDAWIWLQVLLYLTSSALLLRLLFRLNCPGYISLAVAALFSSNYILLKWAGLPNAEPAAVFWTLLAANFAIARWALATRYILCGFILGLAILTRPDAIIYPIVFAVWFAAENKKDDRSVTWPVLILIFAAMPVGLYMLLKQSYSGEALPYLREYSLQDQHIQFDMFVISIMKMFRQPNLLHDVQLVNITTILTHWFFVVALFIACRGIVGPKVFWSAAIVLTYLAAHTFWYYSTERFNLLVLAPSVFLTCSVLGWYFFQEHRPEGRRIRFYYFVVVALVLSQLLYGITAITEHRMNLSINVGKPRLMAYIANRNPGIAWSEIGPEFAHFFNGRTYMDNDQIYFYRRTTTAGEYFAKHNVNWIVTKLSEHDWFSAHPDVSSETLSLRRRASDGIYSLYEVETK